MKPVEYYIALLSAGLYVLFINRHLTWLAGVWTTVISVGLGYSLSAAAAEWTGRSEMFAALAITAFGMRVLDFIYALLSDRAAVMQLIRDVLNRGGPR